MDVSLWGRFFEDALFAAMAAIGFASISHTPVRVYAVCALAAAAAHACRFLLMMPEAGGMHIVLASTVAAFLAGMVAVGCAPLVKVPAEASLFPALLPMIPGMYAYRAVQGLAGCLSCPEETGFGHYLHMFGYNGLTAGAIVLGMVIGANIPVFMLRKLSYQATR